MKSVKFVSGVLSLIIAIVLVPVIWVVAGGTGASAKGHGGPPTPTETVTETTTVTPPTPTVTETETNTVTETETSTVTETVTVTVEPTPTPDSDDPRVSTCEIDKRAGRNIQFVCYDENGDKVPAGQITLEPLEIIKEIIKEVPVPGPTVTIRPPRATKTIRPQPKKIIITERVTVPGPPAPRETVTLQPIIPPQPPAPTETVTVTVEPPTRQPVPPRDTVGEPLERPEPEVRTKTETVVRYVLLGTLVSMVLAGLGLLALFLGYLLGQRDADKNENEFLASLLDAAKIRKR